MPWQLIAWGVGWLRDSRAVPRLYDEGRDVRSETTAALPTVAERREPRIARPDSVFRKKGSPKIYQIFVMLYNFLREACGLVN